MDADRDYYQILLVVPDAPAAMIEASYRTLKQRLRAKPGSVAAEALLDEAYRVLSDPEQRAAYDLERDVALSERSAADFAATTVLDPDAARYAAHRCLFCGTEHGLDHALERDDDCRDCWSPLYSGRAPSPRIFRPADAARIPTRRTIDLYVSWPQAAAVLRPRCATSRSTACDSSVGAPLPANQIVKIDCASCAAVARVAHCEREQSDAGGDERWLVGVEFLTLRFRSARGTFVSARA